MNRDGIFMSSECSNAFVCSDIPQFSCAIPTSADQYMLLRSSISINTDANTGTSADTMFLCVYCKKNDVSLGVLLETRCLSLDEQ